MSVLDGELADLLTDALTDADIPQSCVVTVQSHSGPDYAPIITNLPHTCKGWADTYAAFELADSSVRSDDRKVFVLCASLAIVPVPGSSVTIGSKTFEIVGVQRDPAGAAWVLQCRD